MLGRKKKFAPKSGPKFELEENPSAQTSTKELSCLELLESQKPSLDARLATALKADTPDAYELKRACRCLQETIYWLRQLEGKKHD